MSSTTIEVTCDLCLKSVPADSVEARPTKVFWSEDEEGAQVCKDCRKNPLWKPLLVGGSDNAAPLCPTCGDGGSVPYPENPVVGMACPDCSLPSQGAESPEQDRGSVR